MQLAQKIYEGGHITYMRTDSPNLSAEAVTEIRAFCEGRGWPLVDKPRVWKSREGAQEAHGLLLDGDGQAFTPDQALRRGMPDVNLPAYGHAHLDEAKAVNVLQEQLGRKFSGFGAMSLERKTLASALLSYAVGNKQDCIELLDAMPEPLCLIGWPWK